MEDCYYVYLDEEIHIPYIIQCDGGGWQFHEWELPLIVAGPFSGIEAAEAALAAQKRPIELNGGSWAWSLLNN